MGFRQTETWSGRENLSGSSSKSSSDGVRTLYDRGQFANAVVSAVDRLPVSARRGQPRGRTHRRPRLCGGRLHRRRQQCSKRGASVSRGLLMLRPVQ